MKKIEILFNLADKLDSIGYKNAANDVDFLIKAAATGAEEEYEDDYDDAEKEENGEYGGKGKFELPDNHIAALQVPAGGSSCNNCKYVDKDNHECRNEYYIRWNGDDKKLPDLPLDEICSDWWEEK